MNTVIQILFIIIIGVFASAQNRFLLRINEQGKQEAMPLRLNAPVSEQIKRFGVENLANTAFIDSLIYFAKNSDLTYEFGNLEEEMMMQWYQPGGEGFVREVWWAISSDIGETKEVNVRAWYPNPRLKNVPSTQLQKNIGYYKKDDDPVNLVTAFRELATDTTWIYPPKTSDSLEYAFDPLGVEALWKKGGINVPVKAYSWHVLDMLSTGDTMKFLQDQLIAFTILNTATSSAGIRQEVTSLANPDPPFHSYKFYPRGRLSSADRGWWLRGDFEWGMYMVVEYFSAPKPKITAKKLLNTAISLPRKASATVKMQSVGDPVDVLLHTKVGSGGWSSSTMTRTTGFQFEGNIPSVSPGDSVSYYITAKDSLQRSSQSPTFAYQVLKKKNPLLLIFNGKNLPAGIVDPSIYLKFTMKTDFGAEPYYDFCNISKYTLADMHELVEQYQVILEVTGDGGAFDLIHYTGEWLKNGNSLPAGQKRYYLFADQDHGFINNHRDTIFSDTDPHVVYFGVKGIINNDFPYKQNNFHLVTFPWQVNPAENIADDVLFGFIPGYMSKESVTMWYHPYYEVPLFTNRMDELQPASNGHVLFRDAQSNKPVGVRTVDPNNRWQSYFLAFDWMALDFRSDTSSTKYEYPFLDPKYKWIVDVQNIGKKIAGLTKPTSVSQDQKVPTEFKLSQNYPNPFNPTTIIQFEIPEKQFISLKVFDILGKEVLILLNEQKEAGHHTVSMDASFLSTGMYFYQLTAGGFTATKKMMLVR